jgi:ABC-2 type transport system permease protein
MNLLERAQHPAASSSCESETGGGAWFRIAAVNGLQAWRRLKGLRDQSKLLTALIGLFLGWYVLLAFWLFRIGLRFIGSFPGLGMMLVERLMYLLFAVLLVLLIFSNLVICYTNFFRNRETTYLLTMPVPFGTIFQWKLTESAVLASWAFLFLIAPLVAAFGLHREVAWHFYLVTPLFVGLFIVLPAVVGAWVAVAIARYLDRRLFQAFSMLLVAAVVLGVAAWFRADPAPEEFRETRVLAVLDQLLVKTQVTQFMLLPSYWLSAGLIHWSEGAVTGASFFGLVLLSYTLFFGSLCFTQTGRSFYEAGSRVRSRSGLFWRWTWFRSWRRRKVGESGSVGGVERGIHWMGRWLSPDVRALLVKDVRLFWRDTTQWGQTLVLFGLLAVYILNLRHFSHQLTNAFWIHLVSHLNLGACALNLATLTTRFIYPQFSLEGKRIWIVGMAPVGLGRVIWVKYGLASAASLALTLGLILLSCWMLEMSPVRIGYFMVAVTLMTFTLNGLAVGLGVLYPNFREEHPGKIVSGFGGTFCLVLSFVYIVAVVVLLAVGSPWGWAGGQTALGLTLGAWAGIIALSVVLGWLPLRMALRRVDHFEF